MKISQASFLIGGGISGYRVKTTGSLRRFANDAKGFYGNNSGAVLFTITRRQ